MAARSFSAPVVFNYFIFSSLQNLPRTTRMCRVPIFLSKETIKEKCWPSYRGRRAGQQVNNREIVTPVAQLVEHWADTREVVSLTPAGPTLRVLI